MLTEATFDIHKSDLSRRKAKTHRATTLEDPVFLPEAQGTNYYGAFEKWFRTEYASDPQGPQKVTVFVEGLAQRVPPVNKTRIAAPDYIAQKFQSLVEAAGEPGSCLYLLNSLWWEQYSALQKQRDYPQGDGSDIAGCHGRHGRRGLHVLHTY